VGKNFFFQKSLFISEYIRSYYALLIGSHRLLINSRRFRWPSSVHHKITREERRIARRSAAPKGRSLSVELFVMHIFLWQMVTCDLFAVANLLVTSTTLTSLFNRPIHTTL